MSVNLEGILDGIHLHQPDLLEVLKYRLSAARDVYQKEKVETEAECFELTEQLQSIQQRFIEVSSSNGQLQAQLNSLEVERTKAVHKLNEVQAEHSCCVTDKAELTRSCASLTEDKKELTGLLDRKFEEILRLQDELKDAKNQLKEALLQKCQSQVRIGELNSREVELQYRENKWQQEKQLLRTECDWYGEELQKKEQQILTSRQELASLELRFSNVTRQKDEQLETLNLAKEAADCQVAQLTSQLEELSEQLKMCTAAKLRSDEQYERELECQAKLIEIHKNTADESSNKVMELTEALEKLESLFDETKENYQMLQNKIDSIQAASASQLEDKDNQIKELQIELDKANNLLNSNSRGYLTDDEINALSPSAAAASKLIKSRFSLTQIYKDHCTTLEELEVVKAENVRVKKYLEDIVKDIESKAFKIKHQRDEYMRSLEMNENFKRQLADTAKEIQQLLSFRDSLQRQLSYTRAELERCQRENANMSSQVRELLISVEKYRLSDLPDVNISSRADDDLVLFRNVEELQTKNQQLLSALAEAEANRDEIIRSTQSAEVQSLKDELQICLKQLEDLKTLREKQNEVINAISQQKESYKKLYSDTSASKRTHSSLSLNDSANLEESIRPLSGEIQNLQESLSKLSRDFDLYRSEKTETEKIMSSKMQDLQNANRELISTNTKLNGEIEYERQRFKSIQGTLETRTKTINQLQERSHNYGCTIAKHEATISLMTQELMSSKEELARLRVENTRFRDEIQTAKSNEQRLYDENIRLRQDTRRHDTLSITLQEIQARFERKEAEQTLEMKQKIESLNREKESLEKTLQKITEQHNDYIRGYKETIQSLQIQVDERDRKLHLQSEDFDFTKKRLTESQAKVTSLENQISVMSGSHRELAVERFQKESQQLQGRLNYLTLQHDELQQKNKELSAQLVRAKAEEEQFKRLSETLETTLKGNSEAEMAKITALTDQLDSLSQQLEEKQKNYDDLMGKYKGLEEAKMKLREEFDKQTVLNNYQIATLQGNLAREKTNVAELERSRQDWVNERESLRGEAKDWESQYQRELDSHEADVSKLRAAAEEVSSFQQQLAEAEVNFNEVVEARDRLQAELDDRDNLLVADNNRLQERMKLIEAENEKLLDEVQKLANQIVLTERLARGSGDQAVAEPASLAEDSSEISSASTESLAEIISYLRRERQLASQKEADAVEEANRATRRAEVLEKDRNRLELKLTEATEEMAVLSAAVSEKAALLEKLRVMEAIQLHNGQLNAQVANCEAQLKVLENQLADCRQELLASQNENLNVQSQLDNANAEISAIAQELAVWRQRYDELLAQRSDTEAQEIVRLTNELAEMQEKLDAVSMELRTEREKCGVIESLNRDMSAIAESHKERLEKFDQLNAELEEMTAKNNEANAKLRQAQIIGRKYRDQTVELNQTVKSLKEQLESAKTGSTSEQPSSTGNSVQIEALMNENQMLNDQLNELRSTSINQAEGAEMRDAELQSLQERIEQLETDKIALEAALRTSEEKLEAVAKEKSELEMKLEEINMRLVSLTSMHKTCEQRITKVTQDKSEELNRMAANFEKQLAELRSHGKPALVPPYVQSQTPRLPSTSSPRPTTSLGRGKLNRGNPPPQANVRPIAESQRLPHVTPTASVRPTPMVAQKTRASVAPTTSLSPGPFAVPDQSSSSTTVSAIFQQASAAPNVVSTSHHVANVPQAVVSPRVEGEAIEADTNGGGLISSSSAASSAAFAADTAGSSSDDINRKRAGEREISSFNKKFRSGTPELVTTSDDQLRSHTLPDSDAQPDIAYDQLVQSSQADSYDSDDVVIIEDEPDSGLQERQAASESGFEDPTLQNLPSMGRFALPDSVQHQPDEGDDGIVPSTPTLFNIRSTAPEVNSPHVPSTRFTFSSGLDSSESSAIVSSDGVFESVIHRSVPSGFGSRSPDQTGGEADSHSAEGQPIDTSGNYGDYISLEADETEEGEETSEAMASERDEFVDLDEDSNGASTSQTRKPGVKLRRPIIWTEPGAAGSSTETTGDVGSSSQPTGVRGRGSLQTARRGRGKRN